MHTRLSFVPGLGPSSVALLAVVAVVAGCRPSKADDEARMVAPVTSGGATGTATGRSLVAPPSPSPLPELSAAALIGDIKKVRRLLSKGADVNGVRGDRRIPLCIALSPYIGEPSKRSGPHAVPRREVQRHQDKLQIARLLLDRGAEVNVADEWTLTPLHHAASFDGDEKAFIAIAKELLRRGARVDAKTDGGVTPLLLAVDRRRTEVARLLLKAGADPTIPGPDGRSATQTAEDRGLLDLAREMKAAGASQPSTRTPAAPSNR